MFGRRKSKKSDPVDPVKPQTPVDTRPSVAAADTQPSFAKERDERGLEADDTRLLYDAAPVHPSEGQRFSFDIDGPVPHPLHSRR